MTRNKSPRVPSYRLHKSSGLAVVRLNGRDFYLGKHGCDESKNEYERLVAEWLTNNRQLPNSYRNLSNPPNALTIGELVLAFWAFAETYYVKNGKPTGEQNALRDSLKPLVAIYGKSNVNDFGPLALKIVRQAMIDANLSRKLINSRVNRIRRVFRWGVENQFVDSSVLNGISSVAPLRRGRCNVRETEPVKPASEQLIASIEPHVSRQVWAMVQLQLLTGMRPGEVLIMRICDIDMSGRIWLYRPYTHKTEHHGIDRVIYLGPKAQRWILPFRKIDEDAFLFSSQDAKAEHQICRRTKRRTPMTPSQQRRKPKQRPKRQPGERYTPVSYCRAIHRGCEKAFPAPDGLSDAEKKKWRREHRWSPNQLRHNAATRIRKEYGLDAARAILGHSAPNVTEIYAEMDYAKAADIMAKIG